ncbi:MAG: serine hydrolase domain-containing protein [Flavobacteriales bacterium]|nr:serine hydrolase domain-containing protein [Flavobacteriales bacterium]
MNSADIELIVNSTVDGRTIKGCVLCLHNSHTNLLVAAGNINPESTIYLASTTKLYTTALILKLRYEDKLSLDDKLEKWFAPEVLKGLHVYQKVDYSYQITIRQLLTHTSGLPDYFQQKTQKGKSLIEQLQLGQDQKWSFDDVLAMTKKMKPAFAPDSTGKALYSDTNYQILGHIIELENNQNLETVYGEQIFKPLKLSNTCLFTSKTSNPPKDFYFKRTPLHIPLAMSSFGPDGGIVSTAEESMMFLKAFFGGFFFPKKYFDEMYSKWNHIMFPLEYGIGIMRFKLPWFFSPFKKFPIIYGHSGLSGAFAFYCPDKELFMTGTVNQIANPGTSFKQLMKVLSKL